MTAIGEAQIEIVRTFIEEIRCRCGNLGSKKFLYRETIKGSATNIQGRHKSKAAVMANLVTLLSIWNLVTTVSLNLPKRFFGGSVPKNYIPAVEKGFREAMTEGILAGYPVTNIKVNLKDGSYHPVDSSEMAFKIAASLAL